MTTIAQIIRDGRGKAGSNNSWCVYKVDSDPFVGTEFELWHYSTRMLHWIKTSEGIFPLHASVGYGSVSDQGGMNTAFKVLSLPYRYDRDWRGGGARITDLYTPLHHQVIQDQPSQVSPDAMRWTPEDAEHEIAEWRKLLGLSC